MDNKLTIEIVTPQKIIFSGNAEAVSVPGTKSPFQILWNHAPIVSSLDLGLIKVDDSGATKWFAVSDGFAEVHDNKISVLVETAEDAANINKTEVETEISNLKNQLSEAESTADKETLKRKIRISENLIRAADKV